MPSATVEVKAQEISSPSTPNTHPVVALELAELYMVNHCSDCACYELALKGREPYGACTFEISRPPKSCQSEHPSPLLEKLSCLASLPCVLADLSEGGTPPRHLNRLQIEGGVRKTKETNA